MTKRLDKYAHKLTAPELERLKKAMWQMKPRDQLYEIIKTEMKIRHRWRALSRGEFKKPGR